MKRTLGLVAVILVGAVLILRVLPGSGRGGNDAITAALTTEWLANESDLVFVGVPLQAEEKRVSTGGEVLLVQFRVEKRLKGPVVEGDVVTVALTAHDAANTFRPSVLRGVEQKASAVVFAGIAQHRAPEVDGCYEFTSRYSSGAFFAGAEIGQLYDEAGASIRTQKELLSRATDHCKLEAELARSRASGRFERMELPVTEHSDASQDFKNAGKVILLSVGYRES